MFPYAILDVITRETGGALLHVERGEEIADAFQEIVAGFKTRYLLTYIPRDVDSRGWHPIEVDSSAGRGR